MLKLFFAFLLAILPLVFLNIFEGAATLLMLLFSAIGSALRTSSPFGWSVTFDELVMSDDFGTMIMILYSLASILFFGIWYYTRCEGNYGKKAISQLHPVLLGGTLLMVPGLQLMSSVVCILVGLFSPSTIEAYNELLETAGVTDASLLMLIYSVVLAPLGEELAFRGVTMRLLQRVTPSFWFANIVQAILFGVFHGNIVQGLYAFCLGLVLGYVSEKGGTIYYSMLLHIVFNFWGTVLAELLNSLDLSDAMYLLLLVGMLACLIAGLLIFRIGKEERDELAAYTSSLGSV